MEKRIILISIVVVIVCIVGVVIKNLMTDNSNNSELEIEYSECINDDKTYVYNFNAYNVGGLEVQYNSDDGTGYKGDCDLDTTKSNMQGTVEITIDEQEMVLMVTFKDESGSTIYSYDIAISDYSKETYSFSPLNDKVDDNSYTVMEVTNTSNKSTISLTVKESSADSQD